MGSSFAKRHHPRVRHGIVPLGSEFTIILAILFSLLFIFSISLAFVNSGEPPVFTKALNDVATSSPGIVLLGESVDVDIDEPAITVRWSLIGCGDAFVLSSSPFLHDSSACGIPAIPVEIFVDNAKDPSISYDPLNVPWNSARGQYSVVQNLLQFDSEHVLDVHNARLYPFDTYLLSSSLRAISSNSTSKEIPIPISRLLVIDTTSSFTILAKDATVTVNVDDAPNPAQFLELRVRRPGDARLYAVLIFAINWVLSHFNFGIVVLTTIQARLKDSSIEGGMQGKAKRKDALKQLGCVLAVLLVIPQLRDAMPDAPGFDGVLLDSIGFFPQMVLAGLSAVVLMLILAKRELDQSDPLRASRSSIAHMAGEISARTPDRIHESEASGGYSGKALHLLENGHSRKMSIRDVMLARMMRILDGSSLVRQTGGKRLGSLGDIPEDCMPAQAHRDHHANLARDASKFPPTKLSNRVASGSSYR